MLPGGDGLLSRHRYRGPSMSTSAREIERAVTDSKRRYKRLPFYGKVLLVFSLFFSVFLYYSLYQMIFKNDLQEESFLETDKCPACYGTSACGLLFNNQVQLTGWSKLRFLDITNFKNVHIGKSRSGDDLVLKKLAQNKEIQEVDNKFCRDANRPDGCDISRVIYKSSMAFALKDKPILPKHLNDLSISMFTCASYRLLDRMWSYYQERTDKQNILYKDKVQLLYLANVNTESLLMQTFPSKEGWPFPVYYGACGRYILSQHGGQQLGEFYNAPFTKRADIAHQLLKMAVKMTENKEGFILYWTDLQYENFAVDLGGKVRIIDGEHILVVDKMSVEAKKPRGWDEVYESKFDDCDGKNCLTFKTEELCSHVNSDHNYYALCRNILSQFASESDYPGGFLHDMPQSAKDDLDLEMLLNECARPTKPQGRMKVKERLLEALDTLRNVDVKNINILDEALNGMKDNDLVKDVVNHNDLVKDVKSDEKEIR